MTLGKQLVQRLVGDRTLYRLRFALLDDRPDDQFIAAFPRSGSTWLRTMLTNVMVEGADSNPEVFNAHIPGMSLSRLRGLRAMPSPRLLMTHSHWQPDIQPAVYVVRDGRDALVSFYHYLTTRQGRSLSFEAFFDGYLAGRYGIPWHEHVEGWLGEGPAVLGDRLHVVHFEALKADPASEVERVLAFLGVEADRGRVEAAVEAASLSNMRKIERRRRGEISDPDASFYRGGATQAASPLTPALRERFERVSARALELSQAALALA